MSTKETNKEELLKKLRNKIQSKQVGRLTKVQRQNKVDDMCEKMGISEADMKALAELSQTIMKKQSKSNVSA